MSLEETAICVVDAARTIVKEIRAESAPDALRDALQPLDPPLARVEMEACSLAAWLHGGLTKAGWPAVCIETCCAVRWGCGNLTAPQRAAMKTMPNKTHRNAARAPLWGAGSVRTGHKGYSCAKRWVIPGHSGFVRKSTSAMR